MAWSSLPANASVRVAQGPGGTDDWALAAQLASSAGLVVASGSGAIAYTMRNQDSTYQWTGAAPTTVTITTPAAPNDGQILTISTDTTLTTMVTLTANTGQTLNAAYTNQTLSANTSVEWQYNAASAKWYRIR
ncbi:MAG TPA: hypothetical protein VFV92_01080 [Candidatus Bathyarchaeia archaeon]|nr:hypothetical protein [Candidatus Bathyarchaeia archaeon]